MKRDTVHPMSSAMPPMWLGPLLGPLLVPLLVLVLLLSSLYAHAAGPAPLALARHTSSVDTWPATTVLDDVDGRLDAAAALAAAGRYAAPATARGVLELVKHPQWLRIPLRLAADAPEDWVVQVDFGMLDHVEFYLERDGRVRKLAGSGRLSAEHGALKGRVPAVALRLQPGAGYTLLVRIDTGSSRIAPISIMQPDAYQRAALGEQMLQGLLLGIAACLVAYSLGQWIALRDPLYGKYAMYVGGLTVYSLVWFGLGEQFLWRGPAATAASAAS